MKKKHQQKLVLLSILLFLSFNAPFLLIFNDFKFILGIPIIYIYIFIIWLISIFVSYFIFKLFDEQHRIIFIGNYLFGCTICYRLQRREKKNLFLGGQSLCLCSFFSGLLYGLDLLWQYRSSSYHRFGLSYHLPRAGNCYPFMDIYQHENCTHLQSQ